VKHKYRAAPWRAIMAMIVVSSALSALPAGAQELIDRGSMTSAEGADVTAPGWTKDTLTPDVNDANGPLLTTPGYVWAGGTPVVSPDGGTWQNVFGAEAFRQTVNGLTVGRRYRFRYYYAAQGISNPSFTHTTPLPHTLVVTGMTGYTAPGAPPTLFAWNTYSGILTASATSATFLFRGGMVDMGGYIAYDGISLVPVTAIQLQKTWEGATLNDRVRVNGTGLTPLDSTAGTANETDSGTVDYVVTGSSITLTETFLTGSASNYLSTLTCTGNSVPLSGPSANVLTVAAADTNIVCTFRNTGRVTDVRIAKTRNLATVVSGQPVQFTLTVTNAGAAPAGGTVVDDPAVTGLDCTAASLPAPTCSATGGAVCPSPLTAAGLQAGVTIPTLPGGSVVTVGLTCTVTASGF
jgi:uncharacterized repeat protein (TIGR01451 family)